MPIKHGSQASTPTPKITTQKTEIPDATIAIGLYDCLGLLEKAHSILMASHPNWIIIQCLLDALTHGEPTTLDMHDMALLYRTIGLIAISNTLSLDKVHSKMQTLDVAIIYVQERIANE